MLRIRKLQEQERTIFALSGRIDEQDIQELQNLLEAETALADTMLDLREVRLVDRDCVKYLAACEARGIVLNNCPAFIRRWISTGREMSYEQ
jgi:anti-anti-sigma regulatory factor